MTGPTAAPQPDEHPDRWRHLQMPDSLVALEFRIAT